MNTTGTFPTDFAPAARTDPAVLRDQMAHFAEGKLYREMVDAVPDVLMVVNEERQTVYANRALHDLLGPDQAMLAEGPRPGELVGCIHADDHPGGCGAANACRTCGCVQAVLASQRKNQKIQHECRLTLRDGTAMDFEVWSTPLEVEGERFYLVAFKDIADEKRRRALERIFFHDILNTAGGVVGYAALAQDATPEERDMLIDSLYGLSLRLIDEITSQQELLKAERNELALKMGTVDSRALLYMLAEAYRHHAVADNRHIVVDEGVESVAFTTDGTLLRRVLGNMVKNALEAIHPQETVTLRCVRQQDEVVFSVHNPGVIPERVRLQIFQRSFSTKAHDRGLGTYSMKLLTEQYLQGHVSFTTNPDDGTTFFARLPITRSEDLPGW